MQNEDEYPGPPLRLFGAQGHMAPALLGLTLRWGRQMLIMEAMDNHTS